jgi:hypothetical protein
MIMRRWMTALVVVIAGGSAANAQFTSGGPRYGANERTLAGPSLRLPRVPGHYSPSLVEVVNEQSSTEQTTGDMLTDTETCGSCHPDAAAQWNSSAHSFASFGNPIYRANIELVRSKLGKPASRHCGGCHDMPLVLDGLLTTKEPVPASDLRAHSGVTCRLCHGVTSASSDGNASYVWSAQTLQAPVMGNAVSINAHKAAVNIRPVGDSLCISCHRGFLSPDLGMPAHLLGIDEPTAWRSSAYTGSGTMRMDKVDKQTCISCHMIKEPASRDELGAKHGQFSSHRFIGGHTWMAAMRGDTEHLQRTQAKLVGAASIDIASVRYPDGSIQVPADGARVTAGQQLAFDVVVRNLLVGHRFPGGVLDMHDTWIEVSVKDAVGKTVAQSGQHHETEPRDTEAHVLKSLVADKAGQLLHEHEIPDFRALIANHTVGPREAQAIRYAMTVPATMQHAQFPLAITASLRHRSRSLIEQASVCTASKTQQGAAFLHGAKGVRLVTLTPCAPQPITMIAQFTVAIGGGSESDAASTRPAWERSYELGMALTSVVSERLEEPRQVLERARTLTPPDDSGIRSRAMIDVQLAWVASKQGRWQDALTLVAAVDSMITAQKWPRPPVLSAIVVDALSRVWQWTMAVAPAQSLVQAAPLNNQAWVMLSRVLASTGDNRGALDAAVSGLAMSPRDPDLLRSQAVALAALDSLDAPVALSAFERFRTPDEAADVRIACARSSSLCAREREMGHTHQLLGK